jgi:hypothetical protein
MEKPTKQQRSAGRRRKRPSLNLGEEGDELDGN